jgi:hypothetical protein
MLHFSNSTGVLADLPHAFINYQGSLFGFDNRFSRYSRYLNPAFRNASRTRSAAIFLVCLSISSLFILAPQFAQTAPSKSSKDLGLVVVLMVLEPHFLQTNGILLIRNFLGGQFYAIYSATV